MIILVLHFDNVRASCLAALVERGRKMSVVVRGSVRNARVVVDDDVASTEWHRRVVV